MFGAVYWIFIAIFVLIVLVPRIVIEGLVWDFLSQEIAEMILLFGLGLIALILYDIKDRGYKKIATDHKECKREIFDTSKDLTSTYSYIGEINRKIDILSNIVLQIPSTSKREGDGGRVLYLPIIEGIKVFGGSENFIIGFYDTSSRKILKIIQSNRNFYPKVEKETIHQNSYDESSIIRIDDHYIIRTEKTIRDISVYVVIKKNILDPNDADLIKSLAIQALFLYTYVRSD